MKPKTELQAIIDQIASDDSPVGMDAVYVHALILDKLESIENRLEALEDAVEDSANEEQFVCWVVERRLSERAAARRRRAHRAEGRLVEHLGPKGGRQDGVRWSSRRMRRSISPRDKPQTFA